MLDMKLVKIRFDASRGAIQREPQFAQFSKKVRTANVALNGFDIKYTDRDHHVLRQKVDLHSVKISNNVVSFAADLLLRDGSGNIDDRFEGTIDVLVIADLEEARVAA